METEDPVELEATDVLAEQSAETIDTLTKDILYAGTSVQYASTATSRATVSSGMKITVAEIREAVKTMHTNKVKKITSMVNAQVGVGTVPVDACFIGIVGPGTAYDMKALTGFEPIEKYAGGLKGGKMDGEIGKIDEVRFIQTTQSKVWAGAGASGIDVYGTLILGQNAYGTTRISGEAMKVIRKQLGSAGSADPLDQRSTIGWKATYVAKILAQLNMLRIEHAIS